MENLTALTFPNGTSMNASVVPHQEHLTSFERNFYLFNGLIGTLLNVLVLFIALFHVDTHDKPRQIIVMNMTLADLLTCTLYMLTRSYLGEFPEFLCYPYYVSIVSPQLCSCLNLLWINVDKLLFIKIPLHYYTMVTRCRVLTLMMFTWMSVLALVAALYSFMEVKHACVEVELSARIYLLICLLYIFNISASFSVSAVIFCIAQRSRRTGSSKEAKRLFQRLFFVFSSTLWTFATCLPYRLLYLGIMIADRPPTQLLRTTTDVAYMLLVLGIVGNPAITIITQRLYRHWISNYCWRFLYIFGMERLNGETGTEFSTSSLAAKRRSTGFSQHGDLLRSEKLLMNNTQSLKRKRLESVVELDEEERNGGKV